MLHFRKVCGCERGGLYEARIFNQGQAYGEPWDGAFNVHIQGQEARISLLDKGWTREVNDRLTRFCRSQGVKVARWERRGEDKERRL